MTAIKKFLSDVWAKTKEIAAKVWTRIKTTYTRVATTCANMKNKYVYLFAVFVCILAIFTAVGFIIDSNTANLEEAPASTDEYRMAWHYSSLYSFISNYEERYTAYLADMERFENGLLAKKPTEPEYKYQTAMANRIIQAAKNSAEGTATAMDEFWLGSGINIMNNVSSLIYNQNQTDKYASTKMDTPFFSLWQVVVLFGASIAMLAIITKSSGRYNVGFSPTFGNNEFWNYLSLGTLVLTLPTAIYSLLAKSYTWPVLLFISFVFAQTTLAAFGQFTLRKQGISKLNRFLLSTAGSYAVSILYFLLGMLNASEYGTFGAMSLYFPKLLVAVILFVAPLWVNAAYLMNGSFMATALPYACFGITFSIFPGVILTFERYLYAILLFFVAFAAFIVGAGILTAMILINNKKALPFPGDIACEMYEEGAPEITTPESYTAAVTQKKEKKAAKKAAKNDFAFLDDAGTTTTESENENTTV